MSARNTIFYLALAAATVIGCTGPRAASTTRPFPERQSAQAIEVSDPAWYGTPQQPRQADPLQQVSAAAVPEPRKRLVSLHFLMQGLTPSQQVDLRRAFEATPWRPGIGANGEPADDSSTTIVIRAREE
ncbi:MAG TPA: hypothetical protein VLU43_15320 [Anaeromyxobacteraceae bacterium]|nr:hypothetical protein [Anaeromyxobacteraceae bacterium]